MMACIVITVMKCALSVPCPVPNCICKGVEAVCSGINMTYIPRLPIQISRVSITNGHLRRISASTMTNLTFNNISSLTLSNVLIKTIEYDSLRHLPLLTTLEISHESDLDVNEIKGLLDSMPKTYLRVLFLQYNGWISLPTEMFHSFSKINNIDRLNLVGNNFSMINGSIFKRLKGLYRLKIQDNRISEINLSGLSYLSYLNLAHNDLFEVPKLCDNENESLLPLLKMLRLDYNKIKHLTLFKCLPKLQSLALSNNRIVTIHENCFKSLNNLKELNLYKAGNPISKIEDGAFSSDSMETLTLRELHFRFDKLSTRSVQQVFAKCENLRYLDISYNYFPDDMTMLRLLFIGLKNITTLIMQATGIFVLPPDLFSNFQNLENLILRDNKIYIWKNGRTIFGNLTTLKHLDLGSNRINNINESTFTVEILMSLERISLASNPFYCTCEQMWFVNWIKNTDINIDEWPNFYRCVQPIEMAGTKLKDYNPTVEICKVFNPLFIIVVSVSVFVVIVTVVVFIIVKCQTNIKNYLYLLRVNRHIKNGYFPFDNANDFEYHAFVVYCDADRLWVHREFVRRLENDAGIKLCIHQRDFDVGQTISGNIDTYLRKSWKVVVIMSNEFAKSQWCQWEVDIVQERRRRLGRNVFLLVMLKEITSKHMTSPLRTLLDNTPHLKYRTGVGEDLFWQAVTNGLLKPIGLPPTAVL